jgi:hypothetical protein
MAGIRPAAAVIVAATAPDVVLAVSAASATGREKIGREKIGRRATTVRRARIAHPPPRVRPSATVLHPRHQLLRAPASAQRLTPRALRPQPAQMVATTGRRVKIVRLAQRVATAAIGPAPEASPETGHGRRVTTAVALAFRSGTWPR